MMNKPVNTHGFSGVRYRLKRAQHDAELTAGQPCDMPLVDEDDGDLTTMIGTRPVEFDVEFVAKRHQDGLNCEFRDFRVTAVSVTDDDGGYRPATSAELNALYAQLEAGEFHTNLCWVERKLLRLLK